MRLVDLARATCLADLVPIGLEQAASLHALCLPTRVLMRHRDPSAPHFWRDKGQWVCRSRLGPCGYGATSEEAYDDWKLARLQWAREPTIEPGRSRPLMAHLGQFP